MNSYVEAYACAINKIDNYFEYTGCIKDKRVVEEILEDLTSDLEILASDTEAWKSLA